MRNSFIGVVMAMSAFSSVALADNDVTYKVAQDATTNVYVMPSAIPGTYLIKQYTGAFKAQQFSVCFYLMQGEAPTSKDGVEQALRSSRVVSFNCADSK